MLGNSFTMDNTSIMPKDDMTNCVDDPTGMTNCGGGVTYEHLTDCVGDESGLTDCMEEIQPYPVTTKDVQIVINTDRKYNQIRSEWDVERYSVSKCLNLSLLTSSANVSGNYFA